MTDAAPARPDRSSLLRVLAYYVAVAAGLFLLWRADPGMHGLFSGGWSGSSLAEGLLGTAPPVGVPVASTPWAGALLGAVCMVGALILMVPVTWIYMLTRRHRGYEEAVVHSLLILPVAVTGIVMIVRDSIALAFSLAGIVAAVRFRTTLEDTKDAVYIFLAIGIGIASGVQALGLALALSVIFNAVVLVLWATRFANPYAEALGSRGAMPLGSVQAGPGSSVGRRLVGDPALLDAASPRDVARALEQAARLERHLSDESGRKKEKRANALLLVSVTDAAAAQAALHPILEERAARWKLAEVVQVPGGGWVLEYLVRVEAGGEGALLERLQGAVPAVTAVEMRGLEGLKGRA